MQVYQKLVHHENLFYSVCLHFNTGIFSVNVVIAGVWMSSKAWETLSLVRVLCSCTLSIKQPMETSEIKLILIYNSDLFHERRSWHKENWLNKYISPLAKNPEKIFVFISDFSEVFFIIKIFVTTNDAICPFLVFFDTYLFGICTSR